MAAFRTIPLSPMTGVFDTLSSEDEIGFGNWRVVKNATTRSTRNRQRAGGWRRLFADAPHYNNQDLHDQLTDRLKFYDGYVGHAMGGGGLAGYNYAYFAPSYSVDGGITFPPVGGPYCPVYAGDFASGMYNGCQIYDSFTGYPYTYVPGVFNATGAREHWRMDSIAGTTPGLFGGLNLTNNGGATLTGGKIGSAVAITGGQYLSSASTQFQTGDIVFGFTGWIKRSSSDAAGGNVIGKDDGPPNREYYLRILASGKLTFQVSGDGASPGALATDTVPLPLDTWVFFACWHDSVANTVNVKTNSNPTSSTPYAGGVFVGSAVFYMGLTGEAPTLHVNGALDSVTFWKNRFPNSQELQAIYEGGLGVDYPFSTAACNTGSPNYYIYSFVYTSCAFNNPNPLYNGYPYGPRTPFYDPSFNYDYVYCGQALHSLMGCREAVTMLNEIVTASGRKLIAATMSRVYELNQSAGNWRILADGLGNSGYTADQCGCNSVRGVSATLGGYLIFTNGFDAPSSYFLGDGSSGCALQALQPISDLVALGITRAGGVVQWKGFVIFYDITEDGERMGGTVLWGDLESASDFIESDTSFAGRSTVAVGATILAAAPLGNWLLLYTDKSIIRVTLVGGDDVFNFQVIYEGGDAMKYKFSLVNAGDLHVYVGESDVYVITQFDTRPVSVGWITKAAGFMFKGIAEDDCTYDPINKEACNLVSGGWSDEKREAWISWPTGSSICPTVTLRLNMKFQTADYVDHGFTSFLTFRSDDRPTIGQWMEDLGICPRGSKVAVGPKDGPVCTNAAAAVQNPPLYIRNETENPNLPVSPNSLCALLTGKTLADYCDDCAPIATFITASATDFCLKEQRDDHYYREMLGGNVYAYDGYGCFGQFYQFHPYDTVWQQGSEKYRVDNEKMIKMITLEAEPLAQSTPSDLVGEIGYGSTPSCLTWKPMKTLPFQCPTKLTRQQQLAKKVRPDDNFYFPVWRRGRYLSARFRISGVGGGGNFSGLQLEVANWGQQSNP